MTWPHLSVQFGVLRAGSSITNPRLRTRGWLEWIEGIASPKRMRSCISGAARASRCHHCTERCLMACTSCSFPMVYVLHVRLLHGFDRTQVHRPDSCKHTSSGAHHTETRTRKAHHRCRLSIASRGLRIIPEHTDARWYRCDEHSEHLVPTDPRCTMNRKTGRGIRVHTSAFPATNCSHFTPCRRQAATTGSPAAH